MILYYTILYCGALRPPSREGSLAASREPLVHSRILFICRCNVCMYVCMYVCIYVCMYVCMCMYVCVCVCMYACMYVCTYVCMYVCAYSSIQKWCI